MDAKGRGRTRFRKDLKGHRRAMYAGREVFEDDSNDRS